MTRKRRQQLQQARQTYATLIEKKSHLSLQVQLKGGKDLAPFELVHDLEQTQEAISTLEAEMDKLVQGVEADFNPYVGLRTFEEKDADLFFGRDALTTELVDKVRQWPFLAVMGPSGSGKSSVVRAGLLPELKGGALPGSEGWLYAIFKPGGRPLDALAVALAQLKGGDSAEAVLSMRRLLAEDERGLLLAADLLLGDAGNRRLVLVVDQAEELVTLAPTDKDARAAHEAGQSLPFVRQLLSAVAAVQTPLCLIITLRADFLHRVAEYPELARWITDHDVMVSVMTREELGSAIYDPALEVGGEFEAGLAEELVSQVAGKPGAQVVGKPGALPLLEYTLSKLWEQRDGEGAMTWAAYRAMGEVEGALAARADAILHEKYGEDAREQLRHLLLKLIQPGEGALDSRRRALLDDLTPAGHTPDEVQALLKPLVDERLLTTGRDPAMGGATIEVSHEALIQAWPTLHDWIENGREDLRFERLIEASAKEWEASGQNEDFLWSGLRLANAEVWLVRAAPQLSGREQRFLDAGRAQVKAEQEAERLRTNRLRRFSRFVVALLAITLALSVFLWIAQGRAKKLAESEAAARLEAEDQRKAAQTNERSAIEQAAIAKTNAEKEAKARDEAEKARQEAELSLRGPIHPMTERDEAEKARQEAERQTRRAQAGELAAYAQVEMSKPIHDPSLALLLAREAVGATWPGDGYVAPFADAALQTAIADAQVVGWVMNLPRHRHAGPVFSAAYSPDGKTIVTAGQDQTARIWDAATGQEVRQLSGHAGPVISAAYSPDGKSIVTASGDGTARIWDAATGQEVRQLNGHDGPVNSASYSPDGKFIVTAGGDQTARIWEAATGWEVRQLSGHDGPVNSAAYSPDGKYIVTASWDQTARIWEAATGQEVRQMNGHDGPVNSASYSPDGKYIVTAGGDQTARIWEAATGQEVRQLDGNGCDQYGNCAVNSAAYSPDGKYIVTASDDHTARIWEVATGQEVRQPKGHNGPVYSAAYSPDGKYIITASWDQMARIWEAVTGQEVRWLSGHGGSVSSAAYSPDGKYIVTASDDSTARIWETATGQEVRQISGHVSPVNSAAYSPDGKYIVTASGDQTTRIWEAATGREVRQLSGHDGPVNSAAYSPDGKYIVTASWDQTARIWEAATGQEVRQLNGHNTWVNSAAYSPDGKYIVTASDDSTARIWEAATGQEVRQLSGHDSPVNSAAYSPDGKYIVTAGSDRSSRIWEVATGQEVRQMNGHGGTVGSAAYSPDGRYIVTASWDQTARIWEVVTGQEVRQLIGHSAWVNSAAYSPAGKYIVTASSDLTARIWVASVDDLLAEAAPLIQRDPPALTPAELQRYGLD